MAEAGFYFTPSDASPDGAMCFMCSKSLDGWEPSDDPRYVMRVKAFSNSKYMIIIIININIRFYCAHYSPIHRVEHKKHAPACPFMNLDVEANRLLTYKHWPHATYKHTPEDVRIHRDEDALD